MIQMTLIQIDNYGPWTVTPRPRTESDLQMLQASLFADLNNHFGNKKGLVFFTRFDNLLAISNGLDEEDHLIENHYRQVTLGEYEWEMVSYPMKLMLLGRHGELNDKAIEIMKFLYIYF